MAKSKSRTYSLPPHEYTQKIDTLDGDKSKSEIRHGGRVVWGFDEVKVISDEDLEKLKKWTEKGSLGFSSGPVTHVVDPQIWKALPTRITFSKTKLEEMLKISIPSVKQTLEKLSDWKTEFRWVVDSNTESVHVNIKIISSIQVTVIALGFSYDFFVDCNPINVDKEANESFIQKMISMIYESL